jgi:hypothetical protein
VFEIYDTDCTYEELNERHINNLVILESLQRSGEISLNQQIETLTEFNATYCKAIREVKERVNHESSSADS